MLKKLAVAFMLTMQTFLTPNSRAAQTLTIEEQEEPERAMTPLDEWMAHDNVTQEEIRMLQSEDPAEIDQARRQIFARQEEFAQFWDDNELRRKVIQESVLGGREPRQPTPMESKPGWEDDDMPETFTVRNFETGELEEVAFDDLPEWRNEG